MENKELQITAPEGWEIDREKSTLDKIIFKEVKQKYPMDFMDIKLSVNGFSTKLNLFGRLVLACREWNRIDGFENESITKRGVICRYDNCIKAEMWDSRYNAVLVFKDQSTAELFLSTFNKELQEVKEFL